ncbi:MAG: 4Fe-4S binding protein, partial [Intestinibacter sp.]
RRFWCNICPMGYLVGLFSKFSLFRLKKDCTACTECKACYEACPMGIKSIYTEREKEDITTTNCIMCCECVKKCPEDNAIYMSFLNKKFYVSSRFDFFNQNKKNKKKRKSS